MSGHSNETRNPPLSGSFEGALNQEEHAYQSRHGVGSVPTRNSYRHGSDAASGAGALQGRFRNNILRVRLWKEARREVLRRGEALE